MTDSRLESLLISCEQTKDETNRLFYRPHEINVTRRKIEVTSKTHFFVLNKLYLSEPLITKGMVSVRTLTSYPMLEQLSSFLGTYHIYWND